MFRNIYYLTSFSQHKYHLNYLSVIVIYTYKKNSDHSVAYREKKEKKSHISKRQNKNTIHSGKRWEKKKTLFDSK